MTQITESRSSLSAARPRPSSDDAVAPSHAMTAGAEPVPAEAGDWRLEGLLGEGALARVYRARPLNSRNGSAGAYALKMLHPRWESRPEAIALLRREAKVGRLVADPHVIPILSAHLSEPPFFVVMPRLSGQTLAGRLSGQLMPITPALWIARQTAEALEALHRHGYLHGDVKPANVFIAPNGHVTLLDLGFARHIDELTTAADRLVLGTVNYLAPELLTSALRADERSDIFSLGVVLFEMLAGEPPLVAHDLAGLLQMQNEYRPPNLQALRPDLPPSLAHLVAAMLAKEPLRRPQSMGQIADHLSRLEIDSLVNRAA